MEKSKLLIICKEQFGYLTDVYKWCEYLRDKYDITVFTFFDSKDKYSLDGVKIVYVPDARMRTIRGILFMLFSSIRVLFFKGIILVCYFKECSFYKKICPKKRMIMDIRTLDVSADESIRKNNDDALRRCVQLYDFITYISEGVRIKANVPVEKSALLPLGAETVSSSDKKYDSLKLLYVGTLSNRCIERTVRGFAMAEKLTDADIKYDIIGDGLGNELNDIRALVKEYGLESKVHVHGYVRHDCLAPFYEKCNVGVSFIPITDYFNYQPPTKTFEYALSGMYVIATETFANKEVITPDNGCLISDTPESFANAIFELLKSKRQLKSSKIRESVKQYDWNKIVEEVLIVILDKFSKNEYSVNQ